MWGWNLGSDSLSTGSKTVSHKPQTSLRYGSLSVGLGTATLQAGTKMHFDDHLQQFQKTRSQGYLPDRVNGVFEFEQKLLDGRRGLEAAAYLGLGK